MNASSCSCSMLCDYAGHWRSGCVVFGNLQHGCLFVPARGFPVFPCAKNGTGQ